jgi:small subunit ribosomal protein S3
MGQKVHPYGLRLGIIRQARSTWFAEGKKFRLNLVSDLKIRRFIQETQTNAGVSNITIERAADSVTVTLLTAKPGIVIGPRGRDVERLRQKLEKIAGCRVRVNVEEAKSPDTDATLVAFNIAKQIERRVSFRRAIRQAMDRTMKAGAKGVRCMISGRLQGAEIARTESMGPEGRVPLHTLRADIDYGVAEARTGYGHIGVKVWIYKGDILPPKKIRRVEETPAEAVIEAEVAPDALEAGLVEAAGVVEVAPVAEVAPIAAAPQQEAYVQPSETPVAEGAEDIVVEAAEEGASE